MKKSNKTEQEIQREMEEFSRKVREFREAQKKAFLNKVDETTDIREDAIKDLNLDIGQ